MAEYIDRTELEPDTEWSEYYDGFVSYSQSQIQGMPKADVIERSKINKALEITYKVREMVLHSNRTYEANDVLDIIDEISSCFERNIGGLE